MYTQQDLELLYEKGIGQDQIDTQLNYFIEGFPYLSIVSPASVGKGIMKVGEKEEKAYLDA